jgi:nicotinate phosphoribosyltransferase
MLFERCSLVNKPIITSRLDNDFYNFTMGQLVWRHFPKVNVSYRLTNRTASVPLGQLLKVEELQEQIEVLRQLRFKAEELDYLARGGVLAADYLAWLANARLPEVQVERQGSELNVHFEGPWAEAVFWESPLLALINQLANQTRARNGEAMIMAEARRRRADKVARLAAHRGIEFVEFGLRRRYSADFQYETLDYLLTSIPDQVLGTSNVWLARQFGIEPKGTMAHQLFMVTTALAMAAGANHPIADSQRQVLDLFEREFGQVAGGRLLMFLPDTYGTKTALRLLEPQRAERWVGFRQDSGDPFTIIPQLIDYYSRHGIDSASKTIMPSDSLTDDLMISLSLAFGTKVNLPFGVGTFLTNDTPLPPASIVIKPVAANGWPCGKLTDNLLKAFGDTETVYTLRKEADYHSDYAVQPIA